MKDGKYILIFVAIGLVVAFVVSKPLRQPPETMPRVGTPLRPMGGSTVGTKNESGSAEKVQVYAEGTIELDPKLTPALIAGRPLFIIAKAPGANGMPMGGPPVAVKRIDNPTFPMSFTLTNENNMMGTDFYDGNLVVTARLDKDGVAGPKQPDDFEAAVQVGGSSRKVQVTIHP